MPTGFFAGFARRTESAHAAALYTHLYPRALRRVPSMRPGPRLCPRATARACARVRAPACLRPWSIVSAPALHHAHFRPRRAGRAPFFYPRPRPAPTSASALAPVPAARNLPTPPRCIRICIPAPCAAFRLCGRPAPALSPRNGPAPPAWPGLLFRACFRARAPAPDCAA